MNTSSTFSSLAAFAFNNSGSSGNSYNQNSLACNNKNIYSSSVTQFLNQSIYEPIDDDDNFSHTPTTFSLHESTASTFNYDYYQSQTSMDPETCNSFESVMGSQQGKGVAKNLADVAEAHEQSLKLYRESFDLGGGVRQPQNNDSRRKHQKSRKYKNQGKN